MATVPQTLTPSKAFRAMVYDTPVTLVKVDSVIYVVTDDDVQPFEVEMAPWTTILGEIGLADTQQVLDRMSGGAVGVCLSRQQEVA